MPQRTDNVCSPFSRFMASARHPQLKKKPHLGFATCFSERVRRSRQPNSKNASRMQPCLYDTGRRVRRTTYQRDGESGLDYAMNRYMANNYGRFLTPDPKGI